MEDGLEKGKTRSKEVIIQMDEKPWIKKYLEVKSADEAEESLKSFPNC